MPVYKVLSSDNDAIKVCSLLCHDEENDRMIVLKVKRMTGENGSVFVGKQIDVSTTNREVIPADIRFLTPWTYPAETESESDAEEA